MGVQPARPSPPSRQRRRPYLLRRYINMAIAVDGIQVYPCDGYGLATKRSPTGHGLVFLRASYTQAPWLMPDQHCCNVPIRHVDPTQALTWLQTSITQSLTSRHKEQ